MPDDLVEQILVWLSNWILLPILIVMIAALPFLITGAILSSCDPNSKANKHIKALSDIAKVSGGTTATIQVGTQMVYNGKIFISTPVYKTEIIFPNGNIYIDEE